MEADEERRQPLTVMSAIAMKVAFERIIPRFELRTGVFLRLVWEPTSVLMRQIEEGARGDVIVAIDESMDKLANEEIIEPATRVKIASASLGVAVRRGAIQPDISTVAAFREALLKARAIAYSTGGASGIYFRQLIDQLGISDRIAAVTITAGFTAEKLISGEADLAIQQISELISVPGVEIVGSFPREVQATTNFSAAIFKTSRNQEGALAFVDALVSRAAHEAYETGGLVSRLTTHLSS